jgi:hypothetical protein
MPGARSLLLVSLAGVLAAGCTRPLLKEDVQPSARVTLNNASSGYSQNFYFEDNETCREPSLVGYALQPRQARAHSVPAGKVITLATSAWGLPPPGYGQVTWCAPVFISTKLGAGQSYELAFDYDRQANQCVVRLVAAGAGPAPKVVKRKGTGPFGSGTMAGSFSCEPSGELNALD